MPLLAEQVVAKPGARQSEEFSLVLGGPLYQLLVRSKLLQGSMGNLGRRIAVITAIAWFPLVPLAMFDGRLTGGVPVPFFYDFEVHSRLLFALPLMILAEMVVHMRMQAIAAQFIERQIITETVRPAFDTVLSSAMRLRNSLIAEIAMLLFVLAGRLLWRSALALHGADTWYATITDSIPNPTPAGRWYTFVSVSIFQFVLLRWYYRIFIWSRFLFQVSRLDLNLVPLHPDRCCGLGFLGNVASAFAPILMAHSALMSGFAANRILYEGAKLPDYKIEIIALAVFLLAIVLGPLCVFVPKLNMAKLAGLRTYGRLASEYVGGFANKWSRGAAQEVDPLLGSADIQSLADLDGSFAIVRETSLVPFGKQTIMRFVVVIAVPLIPLAFTMFSPEELIRRLAGVLL